MKTVVVCNQKGGVGKTLISDELAFSFERSGIPVSFFDLDGQGGAIHETLDRDGAAVSIVDTPGALVDSLKEALASADAVVVPVRASSRDMEPLLRMRKIIQATAPRGAVFYVLNCWNRYRASSDFLTWMKGEVGEVFTLPQSESFVQAGAAGASVVEYAKGSQAARLTQVLCNAVRVCRQLTNSR